jgi:hypothetical protein
MNATRKLLAVLASTSFGLVMSARSALAQSKIDPNSTPTRNTGGWVYAVAWMIALLVAGLVVFLIAMYMRYAKRFSRGEETKVVRADRVMPGRESAPRAVDLSQAVPIIVQPPAMPAMVAAATVAVPAVVVAPVAPAPAAAAPAVAPPAAPAVPAAPAAPAPAAPAAPAERQEVPLDQATFDATLEELLAKGTDRRVAEGQARRAAMIAARKKAAGEA